MAARRRDCHWRSRSRRRARSARGGTACLEPTRSPPGREAAEPAMLSVERLVAGYRGRALARLPGLVIAPGHAALLLGPSGSGKTTLLLAIAGLADVIEGAV